MFKKISVTIAALIAMTAAAVAAPGYICNDNSFSTNVRSGPSAQDYRIIDKVDQGYNVDVVRRTENAAGYIWVYVRYNSMRHGYPTVESGWISGDNVCWR